MRAWITLALLCTLLPARAAADSQDQDMLLSLQNGLARVFVLAPELPLDPALRAAADELGTAHLARVKPLLAQWLAEEKQQGGPRQPAWQLYNAVWARLLNELALWQIEAGDAAYEQATLEVLKSAPLACRTYADPRFRDYASRIARLQAMPAARRAEALESERKLLAHWGQPRGTTPPWPEPLPQDQAMAALTARAGAPEQQGQQEQQRLALPPILAADLAANKPYAEMHPEVQCLLQQWWLRDSLRRGAAPAGVLNAFRYGTMLSVSERLAGIFEQAGAKPEASDGKPAFPRLASRFLITGATILSAQLDANARPRRVAVVQRKINVPGIRDERPVAFENIFDQTAIDYGMKGFPYDKAAATPFKFQLQWTLPPDDATPPGAAQ